MRTKSGAIITDHELKNMAELAKHYPQFNGMNPYDFINHYDKAKRQYQGSDDLTLLRATNKSVRGTYGAFSALAADEVASERKLGRSDNKELSECGIVAKTFDLESLRKFSPESTQKDFEQFTSHFNKAKKQYQYRDQIPLYEAANRPVRGIYTAAAVFAANEVLLERRLGYSEQKMRNTDISF